LAGEDPFPHSSRRLGLPPLSSIGGGPFDIVDLGNLDVHFGIPVFARPGKSSSRFSYSLAYDSLVWQPEMVMGKRVWEPATQNPDTWGWTQLTDASTGHIYPSTYTYRCSNGGTFYNYSSSSFPLVYVDPNGTAHKFTGTLTYSGHNTTCLDQESLVETAPDGSGLLLNAQATASGVTATVTTPNGVILAPSAHTVTDPKGQPTEQQYQRVYHELH
jgi:hypothetical protein